MILKLILKNIKNNLVDQKTLPIFVNINREIEKREKNYLIYTNTKRNYLKLRTMMNMNLNMNLNNTLCNVSLISVITLNEVGFVMDSGIDELS